DAYPRAPSRREAGAQRRDADRVFAERKDSVHGRLQRAAAGTARQSVDCDARAEHRTAAAGFRSARHGPRAESGSADDEGRSAGAGQAGEPGGDEMKRSWAMLVIGALVILCAPLVAHHSFALIYLEQDT